MVLGDGDVDDLVGLDEVLEDLPFLEPLALEGHLLDPVVVDEEHVAAGLLRGLLDAGADVAALGLVGRVVHDDGLLGPGLEDELDEGPDDLGVGAGGHLRRPVPADVRLDDDLVALADEPAHAAERGDRRLGDGRRRFALDRGQRRAARRVAAAWPAKARGPKRRARPAAATPLMKSRLFMSVYPLPSERIYSMIPS